VAALVFAHKLGALPENVLTTLLNDRLVLKGTVLEFITTFFTVYLTKEDLDDLVQLLTKARVVSGGRWSVVVQVLLMGGEVGGWGRGEWWSFLSVACVRLVRHG
jgi:hypothetical protein